MVVVSGPGSDGSVTGWLVGMPAGSVTCPTRVPSGTRGLNARHGPGLVSTMVKSPASARMWAVDTGTMSWSPFGHWTWTYSMSIRTPWVGGSAG